MRRTKSSRDPLPVLDGSGVVRHSEVRHGDDRSGSKAALGCLHDPSRLDLPEAGVAVLRAKVSHRPLIDIAAEIPSYERGRSNSKMRP